MTFLAEQPPQPTIVIAEQMGIQAGTAREDFHIPNPPRPQAPEQEHYYLRQRALPPPPPPTVPPAQPAPIELVITNTKEEVEESTKPKAPITKIKYPRAEDIQIPAQANPIRSPKTVTHSIRSRLMQQRWGNVFHSHSHRNNRKKRQHK
jgi:hypothetical protein